MVCPRNVVSNYYDILEIILVKFKMHDTNFFSLSIVSLLNVNNSSISLFCLVELAFSVMLEMFDRLIGVEARN